MKNLLKLFLFVTIPTLIISCSDDDDGTTPFDGESVLTI